MCVGVGDGCILLQGTYSEGSVSRPESLYQEQLSPGTSAADGQYDPAGGWCTPLESPRASTTSPAPAGGAARLNTMQLADLTSRDLLDRPNSTTASPLPLTTRSCGSAGNLPGGIFTPIEARVTSLTNRLRVGCCCCCWHLRWWHLALCVDLGLGV